MEITRKVVIVSVILALATLLNLYRYYKVKVEMPSEGHENETESFTNQSPGGHVNETESTSNQPPAGNVNETELQKLSSEIRMKIAKRQNPENCTQSRLFVYHVNWWQCGLGCTVHVTLQHFLLAVYTNRTFVLQSNGWSYDQKGWDHVFMPLGKCNYHGPAGSLPAFSDRTSNARIVHNSNRDRANKYDWKIPRNILTKLKDLHSDPYAWWVGQFVNYMLRLRPWFEKVLEDKSKMVPLTKFTVGIQIRWGDKIGREANKHPVSEYMNVARKWFERPEHQGLNKTVYVATEQSEAWKDLTDNYREFSFIGAGYVGRNKELDYRKGASYAQRKNELEAILTDLHFLSKCPYLVCTFSSNICRLLYEIMATHSNQPQNAVESLDTPIYWLMKIPNFQATADYLASGKNDIDFKVGDVFALLESSRKRFNADGYVRGTNTRTGRTGRVPMNKLKTLIQELEYDL